MKKAKSGVYIGDTWETFLAQRDRLPNWKIPLGIAAVLHLVVFTGAAVFPDMSKKFEPDKVIIIDLLSLPSAEPAPAAGSADGRQVASRSEKQDSAYQQPPPVEKVARNAAQEKVAKTTEPPAPEVEEVAEVAEAVRPTPTLPVVTSVTPKKKPKVAPKAVPKNVPKIMPQVVQKVVPKIAAKPASPPEPVAHAGSVSLHPLKRKKKLAEDVRLAEAKAREEREQQQEQLQRQKELQQEREWQAALEEKRLTEQRKRLAEQREKEKAVEQARKLAAREKKQRQAEEQKRLAAQRRQERAIVEAARLARQAERAAEQARLEAAQVRREYASVAQAVSDLNAPLISDDAGFSSGGYSGPSGRESGGYGNRGGERGNGNPAVLNQYGALLKGRISSHWQLPEIIKTNSNLRTEVALILGRDGSIADMRIERKSGDNFFDQSVIKALRNSEPLPGFPALMNQRTQEFVLSFTPQGLTL